MGHVRDALVSDHQRRGPAGAWQAGPGTAFPKKGEHHLPPGCLRSGPCSKPASAAGMQARLLLAIPAAFLDAAS